MIYSSADILMILGGDAIIRQEARLSIVDGKPGLDYGEYVYIYVDRYPTVEDFQATWKIWIVDGGSDLLDLVLNAATRLLPSFDFNGSYYTTTDFASEKTVVKSQAEKELEATRAERERLQESFSGLSEGLKKQLSALRDGVDGKDGRDGLQGPPGRDGRDGRDGKDIDATEVELFDLKDVEQSILQLEKGQVLTWDGIQWTNLYVPTSSGGGGGGGGTAVATTENCDVHDGGDFDTGQAIAPTCSGLTSTTIVTESTYQVVVSDAYIGVNYNGLVTITMPTGTNNGLKYMIKDESGLAGQPANYITIVGDGTDLIDSESSVVIGFNYGSLTLIWRDGAWRII